MSLALFFFFFFFLSVLAFVDADAQPPTSSPPSHAVPTASTTATKLHVSATPSGPHPSAFNLSSQLITKSTRTKPLPRPCTSPTRLARVLDGILNQSIQPKGAATPRRCLRRSQTLRLR